MTKLIAANSVLTQNNQKYEIKRLYAMPAVGMAVTNQKNNHGNQTHHFYDDYWPAAGKCRRL